MGDDLKELYVKDIKRLLHRGKTKDSAAKARFNALLPVSKATKDLLGASKMDSPY